MKRTPLFVFIMLISMPLLLLNCKKMEVNENQNGSLTGNTLPVKSTIAYSACGDQSFATLREYENPDISYGNVTIGNDAANVYVNYEMAAGWFIESTILYVGTPEGLPVLPGDPYSTLPDGTGYFHIGYFPYQYSPGWPMTLLTAHTVSVSLAGLPDCFIVVAYARVRDAAGTAKLVSAKANSNGFKSYGFYIDYCRQSCGMNETAYAFGDDGVTANCFLNIPGITSNNWGWTNGAIPNGTYNWPLYAGAGQCNLANGTMVGTLNVVYSGSVATVTYSSLNAGIKLNTTQLWVGNTMLPLKKGKFITAPGQFPYKHENLGGVTTDTFTITGLSGNIYVAAHADVAW